MEATNISLAELANNMNEIIRRVREQRERFHVVDDGAVLAELSPGPKRFTVGDFKREFGEEFVPKGIAISIEEGRQVLRMGQEPPWWPSGDDEDD